MFATKQLVSMAVFVSIALPSFTPLFADYPPHATRSRPGPYVAVGEVQRQVLGVITGEWGRSGNRRGIVIDVIGEGSMLLLGTGAIPTAGQTVVAEGLWSQRQRWPAGIMRFGRLAPFRWPRLDELAICHPVDEEGDDTNWLADDGGWRAILVDENDYLECRHGDLGPLWRGYPSFQVSVEVYAYDGPASPAVAGRAQNALFRYYHRQRARFRSRAMGSVGGDWRAAAPRRYRVPLGRWQGQTVEAGGGGGGDGLANLFVIEGPHLFVFRGRRAVVVRAVGRAFLANPSP